MRWKGRRQSQHVEDRCGTQPSEARGGGALGALLFMVFRSGNTKMRLLLIGGILVAVFVFNINPLSLLSTSGGGGAGVQVQTSGAPPDPGTREYLATMLGDNETVWSEILAREGYQFRPAKMVIYTERTNTPAGIADAGMGPFYMPANETIYIDPSFFREMKERFGATGDFAEAYVIAHEVGHHIQNILGYSNKVHRMQARVSKTEANQLSVRLELHADFLAGVFAHHGEEKFGFLESGDIEEAMRCAQAIGDDRLQKMSSGRIQPDLFTHGTSAQRARWFNRGLHSGQLADGDTFTIPYEDL